ncbi:MAG: TIGR02266 family protein, partial [Myxococcota bacterium]
MEETWVAPSQSEQEQIRYYQNIQDEAQAKVDAERRRTERLSFHTEVTVSSETNFFMGFSENISEGGLFMATMSPPPVGEMVSLFVRLNSGEEVEVEGTVRWHRSIGNTATGCGIQFNHLDDEAKHRFEDLLINM